MWTFTKPFNVPAGVTLTGDGPGLTGTDLVYAGPRTSGAVITAGAAGTDWVNGHISGLEIETDQLHRSRPGDASSAADRIDQAQVGLQILNPTASSTVDNVHIWKFGRSSLRIENRASSPGSGVFQLSDFFVGTSPRPVEVRGSRAKLLFRFGGIDLGPLSESGMLFTGDSRGAIAVVESVKIEGDYDVPGFVVEGGAPVVFVGTTRYLNQSLYVNEPLNSAPAFVSRNSGGARDVVQCLACTALGEQTALALPDLSLSVPTDKFGINLHRLTSGMAQQVAAVLATPEIPLVPPRDVVNLAPLCSQRNCDAALSALRPFERYYLPAGLWEFSRPFSIPYGTMLFGAGPQEAVKGGTQLRYVGASLPGDAAVIFGAGTEMFGWLASLRIDTLKSLSAGYGLRARDATNGSTLEDIAISGFPDGQILVDATSQDTPGPNFFRIARFSLTGGEQPLRVEGGRQTLLIEQGTITVGPTSREGMYLLGGEQLAATRVVESVSVVGDVDVPGFHVHGPAPTAFIASERRTSGVAPASPAFLYTALVPRRVMECLQCGVSGPSTGLAMPSLGVQVPGRTGQKFDWLNNDLALSSFRTAANLDLPAVTGAATVGGALTATRGRWTNNPSSYQFQWVRCKPPDVPSNPATRCAAVAGATTSTYRPGEADIGFYLRVRVAAVNAYGAANATTLAVHVKS
jgi:hypothetical protein